MAAKGESLLLCKCGNPINVVELREQSAYVPEEGEIEDVEADAEI